MKARWQALSARFAAMSARERWMVFGAVLGGIGFVGFNLFLEPSLTAGRQAARSIADQRSQLATLQAQLTVLQVEASNPERAARAQLQQLQREREALDARFATIENALVPPQRMTALLQDLLVNSGLQVLSLRTLPVTPVVERKAAAAPGGEKKAAADAPPAKTGEAPATAPAADAPGMLYRHGVEIRLQGGYQPLTEYLARLEASPVKLLWHGLALSAEKHPRLELTLTLYTLSMDRTWLSF